MPRDVFNTDALKKCLSDCSSNAEDFENFMESIPPALLKRLEALKYLQCQRASVAMKFQEELIALERKYQPQYNSIYAKRHELISGYREPTTEELADFQEPSSDVSEEVVPAGVPNFWLVAMQNHPDLQQLIEEHDVQALEFLSDIRLGYLSDKPGFRLEFHFLDNPFFSETVLSKEYHLVVSNNPHQDCLAFERSVGCPISWKQGKNLCIKTVTRTQRHRSNNSTRTIKREEETPSFFHFFAPPTMPESSDIELDEEDGEKLENDYHCGEVFKDQLIPFALDWFTGEALDYDGIDEEFGDDQNEDASSESGSEDSTDVVNLPQAEAKPECKQQ